MTYQSPKLRRAARQAAVKRYNQSAKGKAARKRYQDRLQADLIHLQAIEQSPRNLLDRILHVEDER